jgi:hypothetical protein
LFVVDIHCDFFFGLVGDVVVGGWWWLVVVGGGW